MVLINFREFLFVIIFIVTTFEVCLASSKAPTQNENLCKNKKPKPIDPIGSNPCTWGPSYWCASAENAKKCGITDCDKYMTNKTETSTPENPPLVGSNPCTWGPSYWCASAENAKKCGVTDCDKYVAVKNETSTPESTPLVGGNPCTWGPSYWCANFDNAKQCGFNATTCAKYGGIGNNTATTSP